MARMTPGQFSERLAADMLDPIDDTWMLANLMASIENQLKVVVARFGNEKLEKGDIAKVGDYLPKLAPTKPAAKTSSNLQASQMQAKAIYGRRR